MTIRMIPLLPLLFVTAAMAQECDGNRYRSVVFNEVTSTLAVPFGSNSALGGGTQTLLMDVYEPLGDTQALRPVVLVTFGGSFVSGTRGDVAGACIEFAKRGFVAIAPDYRVGFFLPNSVSTAQAVLRGAHDMKACVRYLRRTVVENEDPYRIDPERILIGGFSAGAISALHAGYLDQVGEWPAAIASQVNALGGIEGTSGSPEYSSDVMAVFSFSGAIGDTTWIQPDDIPLCSVHEIGDQIVPYYTEEVAVFGIPTGLIASGSHDIHVRMDNLELDNCLLTYPGNGHVGYVNSDPEGSMGFVMDFCADLVCGNEALCGNIIADVPAVQQGAPFGMHPNPTNGLVRMEGEGNTPFVVLDVTGREVYRASLITGMSMVDLSAFPDGIYLVRSLGPGSAALRLVKTH